MSGIIAQNINRHSGLLKSPEGGGRAVWNLIETQTASSSSTISFTSGIDSTYDEYVFKFYDIHPATDGANLTFQSSTNTGSSYGVTATTTCFIARHHEDDSATALVYQTSDDEAQSTNFLRLSSGSGNDNDQSLVGTLQIFNPSSTTFVKHFICRNQYYNDSDICIDWYMAGYFNTTSAVDALQFKFSTGNIDAGDICLYGIA